jgi:hypothetical protein
MNAGRIAWSIVGLLSVCSAARGGAVTVFTDLEAFRAAAGDVHEIDFETLPDGSPSYFGALITPEFNYAEQGVEFSPKEPLLFISGNPISGFHLTAGSFESGGPRNWMVAELVAPAYAVGIIYPGDSYLTLYTPDGSFLDTWVFGGSGSRFLGVVSDVPIGTAVIDRMGNSATVESFFYTPVPEPATLTFLAIGAFALLRATQAAGWHCWIND